MPLEVLERVRQELTDYQQLGVSIMEISHRSKTFESVCQSAEQRLRRLTGLSDDFAVLFLHGGATQQFGLIPMNFFRKDYPIDMVHSGHWTERAMKEMMPISSFRVIASSEDKKFRELPRVQSSDISPDASYLHYCSNNTIFGTQWSHFVLKKGVPTVVDMSSDILSRRIDYNQFDLIFAGAQKNVGPSGLCVVLIRKSFAERGRDDLPPFLQYRHQMAAQSLYNTPNTFAIYMADLVFEYLESLGGIDAIESINRKKAKTLYDFLDSSSRFFCPVKKEDRSMMNVVFDLREGSDEARVRFLSFTEKERILGLKGHRIAGGFRASIYNAMTLAGVEKLVETMRSFESF